MDPVALSSLAAASQVNQNYAAMAAQTLAAGQDPSAGGAVGTGQATVATQASVGTLKKALDIEASMGAQLAQMIAQGTGINITA